MANIPFEKQLLPVNPVEQIDHKIAHGISVSGSELFPAIERSGHRLDDCLRELISKFSVPAVKRRGRPSNSRALEDFTLARVGTLYPKLLQKYERKAEQRRLSATTEGTNLPTAEPTPSELAYTKILKHTSVEFPNIGWEALRNKHTAWKNGHFHSVENDIDSDDFDAEIDRLFPQPES